MSHEKLAAQIRLRYLLRSVRQFEKNAWDPLSSPEFKATNESVATVFDVPVIDYRRKIIEDKLLQLFNVALPNSRWRLATPPERFPRHDVETKVTSTAVLAVNQHSRPEPLELAPRIRDEADAKS